MAVTDVQRHLFSVDEFARMGEAGVFAEGDRVELIDGEICEMTPIGPPHAVVVNLLAEHLITRLAGRAYVSIQNPVRLDRHTEPQPDLTVARRRLDAYAGRHPEAGDILLVIEVADSSLRYDRTEKVPTYGRAGVPETWLVDLAAETVTVYTGPGPDGYTREQLHRRGGAIAATGIPEIALQVDEMFA